MPQFEAEVVFDVGANVGHSAIKYLMWFAGAQTAVDQTFQTTVVDGTLNIVFTTVADNAKVSAIQVVALAGTPILN